MNKPTIIVTGAGGGIGQVVAKRLAKEQVNLVLLGRRKTQLDGLKKFLGRPADAYTVNVADAKRVKSVVSAVAEKYKTVDAVINIAGILGPIGEFHTQDLGQWKSSVDTNLIGTANVCHAALGVMVRQKSGKIVNFSGGGAVQPFVNFSGYAASKAAVVRFSENLAREYQKRNIQINCVAPGLINTRMAEAAIKAGIKKAGGEYYRRVVEAKRHGGDDPVVAAELVAWLISPNNKLTGKLIAAQWDGWRAWRAPEINKLNQSNLFTLRRIDGKHFYEKK